MEILKTENLECSHESGQGGRKVVSNVNICIRAGDIVSLKGPSGSGKTTLLNALSLMIPVNSGRIYLNGFDSSCMTPEEWRRKVALVNQKHTMLPGTVRENLLASFSLKANRGKNAVPPESELRREMDSLGLSEISLDEDSSKISIGQAARIAFLRSLLMKPDALLLDETTAPLDRASAALLEKRVADFAGSGGCVIVVAHSDEVFRDAKKYFIKNGGVSGDGDTI